MTDQYSIIGQGTTGDPLRMGDMGAMIGQYLSWDGNKWFPDAYRGLFPGAYGNETALTSAHPTAKAGNYALKNEIPPLDTTCFSAQVSYPPTSILS